MEIDALRGSQGELDQVREQNRILNDRIRTFVHF